MPPGTTQLVSKKSLWFGMLGEGHHYHHHHLGPAKLLVPTCLMLPLRSHFPWGVRMSILVDDNQGSLQLEIPVSQHCNFLLGCHVDQHEALGTAWSDVREDKCKGQTESQRISSIHRTIILWTANIFQTQQPNPPPHVVDVFKHLCAPYSHRKQTCNLISLRCPTPYPLKPAKVLWGKT